MKCKNKSCVLKISGIFILGVFFAMDFAFGAAVVSRTQPATRRSMTNVLPTEVTNALTNTASTSEAAVSASVLTIEPIVSTATKIVDKTSKFDSVFGGGAGDSLANMIAQQRQALDALDENKVTTTRNANLSNLNICDSDLRKCITSECGNDYSKCATDTISNFDARLAKCGQKSDCSNTEYKAFSAEIVADKDVAISLLEYTNTLSCGADYNICITNNCGTDLSKCLGTNYANAAVQNCKSIADRCSAYDTGLSARFQNAIAALRVNAEKQIFIDESRLYELRELMATRCAALGAMFDERTLDCVYTAEIFANGSITPFASRKLYAGSTFNCTPEWFGIDLTTYLDNALRLDRNQASAVSSMMGAGLGIAAGSLASGAVTDSIKNASSGKDEKQANTEPKTNSENNEKKADDDSDDENLFEKVFGTKDERDAKKSDKTITKDMTENVSEQIKQDIANSAGQLDFKIPETDYNTIDFIEEEADPVPDDVAEYESEQAVENQYANIVNQATEAQERNVASRTPVANRPTRVPTSNADIIADNMLNAKSSSISAGKPEMTQLGNPNAKAEYSEIMENLGYVADENE